MEDWQKTALEAQRRKELKKRFPMLDLRVRRKGRRKWEYGVIVVSSLGGAEDMEYFIRYEDGSSEQLICLPFDVEVDGQWVRGEIN